MANPKTLEIRLGKQWGTGLEVWGGLTHTHRCIILLENMEDHGDWIWEIGIYIYSSKSEVLCGQYFFFKKKLIILMFEWQTQRPWRLDWGNNGVLAWRFGGFDTHTQVYHFIGSHGRPWRLELGPWHIYLFIKI